MARLSVLFEWSTKSAEGEGADMKIPFLYSISEMNAGQKDHFDSPEITRRIRKALGPARILAPPKKKNVNISRRSAYRIIRLKAFQINDTQNKYIVYDFLPCDSGDTLSTS